MTHGVALTPLAIEDLIALHRWVSDEAGPSTAAGYLDRIEARIAALAEFSGRGTPRDDLADGVRTLTFERRLVIAYRVEPGTVTVLRVIGAMRELAPLFGD